MSRKNKSYPAELKYQAVADYLSGAGSLRAICKKYKIGNKKRLQDWIKLYNSHKEHKVGYQQIYTWVQKYKKDGEEGLKDRRGRHKKDYKPQTKEERLKLEVATLKRQLYLSQMEIDVLKKLQELERGNR